MTNAMRSVAGLALESILIYRIITGDKTYPHSGNFTISVAGKITIDDSNGTGDALFGDFTHTGSADVPDQNVTASTVAGINVGNAVDSRYYYTITSSDGSSGRAYFVAAKKLVVTEGVDVLETVDQIDYFHLLFDDRQIIFSNGAATKSLFLGPEAIKAIIPARPEPDKRSKLITLIARHLKNNRSLQ